MKQHMCRSIHDNYVILGEVRNYPHWRETTFKILSVLLLSWLSHMQCVCRDVAPAWRCEVLFCDDSSRFECLNQLTKRHTELAARQQHLQATLDSANRVRAVLVLSWMCCRTSSERHQPYNQIVCMTVFTALPVSAIAPLDSTVKALRVEHAMQLTFMKVCFCQGGTSATKGAESPCSSLEHHLRSCCPLLLGAHMS